jgi:DNA polymerase-3 subunit epsilon
MREIVLDTETTGLDPAAGHRIVEIGCVELINHLPSGRTLHHYINPERSMPSEAFAVHGLSEEFLAQHPPFAAVAAEVVDFLGEDRLVIHNAEFDMKFLNAEFRRLDYAVLPAGRAFDTVALARRRFPGSPASLDALCRRFAIDNTAREKHGALLDAQLLASVYLELIGGRQPGLALAATAVNDAAEETVIRVRDPRPPRPHAPTAEEQTAHAAFLQQITKPIWSLE